ncbi:MAG TPA: Uma2 family endonuclease [Thermomicrobiales bacterium]|nr:Uma2 family endonuclease [Thermomicrobiales bacterium]
MAITPFAPMTAQDLAEYPDDGLRYEIINGELYAAPAPLLSHQELAARIFRLLDGAVNAANAGKVYFAPVDVRLSRFDVVQPDLLFVSRDRLSIFRDNQFVEGAPDIVVEIASPSTRVIDLVRKAALYARSGVVEYWTVDPLRDALVINVLRNGRYEPAMAEADGRLRSAVLPDLAVDPEALFAGLPG